MKFKHLILSVSAGALALGLSSCENSDISFPDYDGGISVYFPYQYPIRTITLGDITTYDNSKENNEHKFTIYSTMGGSYSGKDLKVDFKVDESLVEGLTFQDGTPVKAMPSEYYTLSGNTLDYGGTFRGGVDVQLTDAFFADPASVNTSYVIPLMMTQATGAQRILDLSTATPIPALVGQTVARTDVDSWVDGPRDFTLFCVNYINKYDGNYLRRGVDNVTGFGKVKVPQIMVPATAKKADSWDNQFWIVSNTTFNTGDELTVSMKVKADKSASVGTQTHKSPGDYLHWAAIGNVNFTEEWSDFTYTGTVSGEMNGGYSIAFNLNDFADANNYYIDDISLKVNGVECVVNGDCSGDQTESFSMKIDQGTTVPASFDSIYDPTKLSSKTTEEVRHKEFVEYDEVIKASTKSLNEVTLPISLVSEGMPVKCNLLLTFDGSDNCTITSATDGITAEGTGSFKSKAESKSWGNKDRDALYLNYSVSVADRKYQSTDTLVVRDRGNAGSIQTFKPIYTQK